MYSIPGIAIRGVSAVVPTTISRTDHYDVLSEAEQIRFIKGTGVRQRRIANEAQCASDLSAFAVDDVLAGLNWSKDEIGIMVLVTQSPDYEIPSTSIVMQDKLGMPQNCICFDVNLGCSAYPYGLAIVTSMMKSLSIKRGLLLVGDVTSKGAEYADRAVWPLFGDAGTATALELSDDERDGFHFHLMNDGAGKDAILIPIYTPTGRGGSKPVPKPGGDKLGAGVRELRGADIFNFAIKEAPLSIKAVVEHAGLQLSDINFFALHQANKLINETIRTKLGASRESFLYSLADYGNTSSASVALTLALNGEQLQQESTVLLSGFGVGLSWGSVVTRLSAGCFFSLKETADAYPD